MIHLVLVIVYYKGKNKYNEKKKNLPDGLSSPFLAKENSEKIVANEH